MDNCQKSFYYSSIVVSRWILSDIIPLKQTPYVLIVDPNVMIGPLLPVPVDTNFGELVF